MYIGSGLRGVGEKSVLWQKQQKMRILVQICTFGRTSNTNVNQKAYSPKHWSA